MSACARRDNGARERERETLTKGGGGLARGAGPSELGEARRRPSSGARETPLAAQPLSPDCICTKGDAQRAKGQCLLLPDGQRQRTKTSSFTHALQENKLYTAKPLLGAGQRRVNITVHQNNKPQGHQQGTLAFILKTSSLSQKMHG